MKLFFYLLILTNNNLLLKIYCENIMIKFINYDFLFFILFFILSFHSPPHVSSIPLLLFLFLPQNLPQNFICSSIPKKKKKKKLLFSSEKRERRRQRERGERLGRIGLGLHRMHLHHRSSRISAACISTAALTLF